MPLQRTAPSPLLKFGMCFLTALALGSPRPALAAWSPTGEPASTGTGTQGNPAIASDGAGGAIVVFQDRRSGALDIAAQRIDAGGTALWGGNGTTVCGATGNQLNAGIVGNGSGGAFLFWEDGRVGFPTDIYAQSVDGTGTAQWTADGVAVCAAVQAQSAPVGASDGAGGVIIAWVDRRNSNFDIYAQRLDAAGAPQWTLNGVAVCTAAATQQSVQIIADGAGGAWIAWVDSRAGSGASHIYAQRVDATGTPLLTANGIPICTTSGSHSSLALSPAPSSGLVLAWRDTRNGLGEIFMQYADGAGAAQWTPDGVSITTTSNSSVALAADGANQYLVWDDTRDVGETQIYAQRIDATGAPVWTGDAAVCTAPGSQLDPRAATDASGRLVTVWRDSRNPGTDIYAQIVDATGAVAEAADGVPICAFPDFRQSVGDDARALG